MMPVFDSILKFLLVRGRPVRYLTLPAIREAPA